MSFMRPAHLRSIDLNLLLPLQALLEERNVTRAARRINLSQSATSRALERLRLLLSDHLLVRTPRQISADSAGKHPVAGARTSAAAVGAAMDG